MLAVFFKSSGDFKGNRTQWSFYSVSRIWLHTVFGLFGQVITVFGNQISQVEKEMQSRLSLLFVI